MEAARIGTWPRNTLRAARVDDAAGELGSGVHGTDPGSQEYQAGTPDAPAIIERARERVEMETRHDT